MLKSKQRLVSSFQAVSQRGGTGARAALGRGPVAPLSSGQEASLQLVFGHISSG